MKTKKYFPLLLIILAVPFGCKNPVPFETQKTSRNALLPEHVYVMQEFELTNEINPQWISSFDYLSHLKALKAKADNGKIAMFGNNLYNLLDIPRWKKEPLDSVRDYNIDDLNSIVFLEEWALDPETFKFTKKEIAQGPVKLVDGSTYDEKNQLKELLFWYLPDSLNSKLKNIEGDITYLINFRDVNSVNLSKNILISTIMEAVLDKKLNALDYFTDKELTNEEIKTNCGFGDEQVAIMDPNDGSISYKTVKKQVSDHDFLAAVYYDDITEIIFTENWSINENDMIIHKTVKQLAFVREFYRDDQDDPGPFKQVIFKVNI